MTKTDEKAMMWKDQLQTKSLRQELVDTFAVFRLLAAADKIERAEQAVLQRRG